MTFTFLRRAVVASLLMLLALGATGALGVWQYTVAHRNDVEADVRAAAPIPLSRVSQVGEYLPESAYGQLVTASGELDCGASVSVTLREAEPFWLVCPLVLEDGSRLAVVVGEGGPIAYRQVADVVGRMQPAQDFEVAPARYPATAPTAVEYLNTSELAMRWRSDVHDGYLVLANPDGTTAAIAGLAPLAESDLNWPPVGIELRNLFYAWQWWIFAGFAVFIWGRYLRDEWRRAGPASPANPA